jgi:hypothetical protein
LRRNCLLKHVTEGKLEGRIEMTGRWGRRRKQLLDDLKAKRRSWKLKDCTLWKTRFGRGYGPVVRQTTEWMNEWMRLPCSVSDHMVSGQGYSTPLRAVTYQYGAMVERWSAVANRRISQCSSNTWSTTNAASTMAIYKINVETTFVQFYFTVQYYKLDENGALYLYKHWLVRFCLLFLLWIIQHSTKVACVTAFADFRAWTHVRVQRPYVSVCCRQCVCFGDRSLVDCRVCVSVHIFFCSLDGISAELGPLMGPLSISRIIYE